MNKPNFWLLRLGEYGQYEDDAIAKNQVSIDFGVRVDPKKLKEREDVDKLIEEINPDAGNRTRGIYASQVYNFIKELKEGDIVVCSLRTFGRKLYIGKIKGECESIGGLLTRRVEWQINDPLSRDRFQQDLLRTFNAFRTLYRLQERNAGERISKMMKNASNPDYKDEGYELPTQQIKDGKTVEAEEKVDIAKNEDLEETAMDAIRTKIAERFTEHEFERLIEEILKAKGYETQRLSKGKDGGIDIIAGRGEFGFSEPRIIVQVKSGKSGIDSQTVFDALTKRIGDRKNVQYGLFVSWAGFPRKIWKQARDEFFNIRLWDRDQVMQELLEVYNKLSDDIKEELPLKQIWALEPEPNDNS